MSRVFVLMKQWRRLDSGDLIPLHDFSAATPYGKIVFLLDDKATPHATDNVTKILSRGLADFSDDDYLLPVGNPVLIAMAGGIAADANDGRVKYLCWSPSERAYIPVFGDLFKYIDGAQS